VFVVGQGKEVRTVAIALGEELGLVVGGGDLGRADGRRAHALQLARSRLAIKGRQLSPAD